jgi:hypothetical protein
MTPNMFWTLNRRFRPVSSSFIWDTEGLILRAVLPFLPNDFYGTDGIRASRKLNFISQSASDANFWCCNPVNIEGKKCFARASFHKPTFSRTQFFQLHYLLHRTL